MAFMPGESPHDFSVRVLRGDLKMVHKDDSYSLLLSKWHPITLLNVDYKISWKAIAKKIEVVLPKLIFPD